MSAPLIPDTTANKVDTALSRFELEHRESVAKVKAVDAMMANVNAGVGYTNEIEATKAALVDLHPRVLTLKAELSPDAASLLSLVVKADEVYRGGQLIDLSSFAIKCALGVTEPEAVAARSELEARGLISFHDNGAGVRGFYPRLP